VAAGGTRPRAAGKRGREVHELSIAQALVTTVTDHVGELRVYEVTVRLGMLTGVVPESLHFCWELVTAQTPLEGSRLVVDRVPLPGTCVDCGTSGVWTSLPPLRCPGCGGRVLPNASGREMEIATVEVEDPDGTDEMDGAVPGTGAPDGGRTT